MYLKNITIFNKNNLKLAVIIHIPDESRKYPAVILLHGFTGYKEERNYVELANQLVNHGYVVIRFDASGFGESEGTLTKDYRFSNYLSDIEVIYQYLISQKFVDNKRIGLMGHSMGAMLSIIYASQNRNIKAICSVSPPYKMGTTDLLKDYLEEWKVKGYWEKVSSKYGKIRVPYAFIEDAQKYNVFNYIVDLKTPKLIIWGSEDKNVRPEDTKRIYEKAGQSKEFLEVSGMGHYYREKLEEVYFVNRHIIKFFNRYLKKS